ncbi:MAG: cysteine methyltransferase [Polaromonas sp. 39-63-203]|jgi:methylated-DNA-[protein]-cysteine S-methyltransferase|uniref:methylated-DNA--[protein]-cysteine S-methyltransferase n=1 Tax=Polaromonas sp. TaxID=1869339 RepID=UPI000BD141D0|nr:methylated-DNA--[protein]-cysteine S-methyltransferase [Polaromonas sp.]OYY52877.1 MAG: cysteine methyltransferase [Polaromonas sp. 35-63-240]OYY99356.1 MAG: cysteine methyltransferase [Polaromonas sp. 28-63-22]OYZ83954.1 MAG: cysteine methyltransferase [Polaromonas sp. 24-62-144]OZA98581.1 MAG: cysteine methyltransferase [Polaromonas sp. 39-63-203]HQS33107.1 methylated-DNA--[protein]-cysteine S-methyltransferase [Polaromonas sp.]
MKFHPSIVQARFESPLGTIILAATPQGLAGLWFEGQRHLPAELAAPDTWPTSPDHPVLAETIRQLNEYFAGARTCFEVPLDLSGGTAFQQSVWQALIGIPAGGTASYSGVGRSIGKPAAVRAVGAAVGRNPVSIIVPCHRVMGADGALTGYAGGLARKTALLTLEGVLEDTLV